MQLIPLVSFHAILSSGLNLPKHGKTFLKPNLDNIYIINPLRYQPSLYQPTTVTGLSPLIVPDTTAFPKRLLYLNDYLPLANSAAETLLQQFISNISSIFDMQVSKFDLISTIESANTTKPIMDTIGFKGFNILDGEGQWDFVARPLITKWASLNDGRFPPVENSFRSSWQNYSSLNVSDETRHANYASFLTSRKIAVDWFESNILFETEDSCSESIMIYDVGFQGLPTYRQESLDNDNGTYKYYIEHVEGEERRARREDLAGTSICPSFACVDFTLPIGMHDMRRAFYLAIILFSPVEGDVC